MVSVTGGHIETNIHNYIHHKNITLIAVRQTKTYTKPNVSTPMFPILSLLIPHHVSTEVPAIPDVSLRPIPEMPDPQEMLVQSR